MSRLFTYLIREHPLAILLVSVVFTFILAAGIPNLGMRPFFEGDLPADDPVLKANERYSSYFGSDERAYLAVVNDTIYRPSTLAKIVSITDELNSLDDVLKEETLSLATVRKVKSRDWGLDISKYLSPLPTTPEEVARLREDIRLDDEIYGRLVSTDETSTLLAVKLRKGYDQRQLYHSLRSIAETYSGPERIYPFGHQVMNEEANLGIAHDATMLGPLALILMMAAIYLFFGSVRLTLSSMLMVIMSIIWTAGLMHYLGFPLSILSASMPAVLIVQGSSYAIHVIHRCNEEASRGGEKDAIVEGVGEVSRALLLSAGMSMFGFATLVVFKILSIREFGICVATGVGFAALLSMVVLPSIMVLQKGVLSAHPPGKSDALDKVLTRLTLISLTYSRPILIGVSLVIAVSIVGIFKMRTGVAPEEIFPPDSRAREVVSLFLQKFHGPYTLNVMFTAERPDGLKSPDTLKRIEKFQHFADGVPGVKYTHSLVDIIKRMNRILHEDNPQFDTVPESEEMVAQLLLLHSLTNDPAQYESVVDYDLQRCRVAIMTTAIDSAELEDIYRSLAAYCEQHMDGALQADFGGRSMVWIAQNEYIIRGKIMNIITNVFPVLGMCALAFRSFRLGVVSILPLSVATLAAFGLMGHLGIRLDMATAVLTGICVGVGVDSAVHFISRLRSESLYNGEVQAVLQRVMRGTGRAIVFDATANALGFVTFIFSGFTPIRTLGLIVCFTMSSCLLLTLVLIPAIIASFPVPFRHPGRQTVYLRAEGEAAREKAEMTE